MKNAEFKDIVPLVKHLFWWVPKNELNSLSPDAIVEAVISNESNHVQKDSVGKSG
ncbi:MAG: hypothetical protein ACYDH8_00295 [Syntrophales bacterium]